MKILHLMINSFTFIYRVFKVIKSQLYFSMLFLLIITTVLSIIFYNIENTAQPGVFANFEQSVVWALTRYIDNADGVIDKAPITTGGKVIAFILGMVAISIVVIPTGLIGAGFNTIMEERKKEQTLKTNKEKLLKSFKRSVNKNLREYLNKNEPGLKPLNIVPNYRPLSYIQVRQGLTQQDIIDVASRFHEFRIKNMALSFSDENVVDNRFILEMAPINTNYGCCINRKSSVTIVSTSGWDEIGTSWFTYYLAKFGGFNYISKEIEVDPDEPDSFYNFNNREEDNREEDDSFSNSRKENKKQFMKNLQSLITQKENPWVIVITEHIKDQVNKVDFHFSDKNKDGDSTIVDKNKYKVLLDKFENIMKEKNEYEYTIEKSSTRYTLLSQNILYCIKNDVHNFNGFVLHPSSEIMSRDSRRLIISFKMAKVISEVLTGNTELIKEEELDLFKPGYGYKVK